MMEKLINDKYDCNEFSFDFPNEMFGEDDRKALMILDDMPEICASYDEHKEDEEDLLNDQELIEKVKEVYEELKKAGY